MMSAPQLQRDVREVENELRLARNRLAHYRTLDEQALATDTARVVAGLELLKHTLTTRILALSHAQT